MKQFITTKLFHAMQEVSQKGTHIDMHALRNVYDEFVALVFSEHSKFQNHTAYRDALVYTVSELTGMAKQVEEKGVIFFCKPDIFD
jgi:hypothetical protein